MKYENLKKHNCNLKRTTDNTKSTALAEVETGSQLINTKNADQTRVLCVLLTLNAVVSYRSVPRILELFKSKTTYSIGWVPHFTSVINWSLRLGLGLLTQVQTVTKPWIAIIDSDSEHITEVY